MAGEYEFHDENPPPPPPPPVTPTQQAPHTLSTIKLPILKKGEYDIWAMKMEHYLRHTDYPIWEVKGKWSSRSLNKYKWTNKVQLEKFIVQVGSTEYSNQNFLGLYLVPGPKVFKSDVKGSTTSSSSTQNVAFVSSESPSSTNDVVLRAYVVPIYQEDLNRVYEFDLENGLKCKVSKDFMRMKEVIQENRRKLRLITKGNQLALTRPRDECLISITPGTFAKV
ncbi:hypothetical protein Tco_1203285 [Tanacetum coccineum]